MIKTDLIDIIKTGRFGSVSIGNSKDHVLNEMGEPDASAVWNASPDEFSEGLVYNSFEFTFYKGKLIRYHNNKLLQKTKKFDKAMLKKRGKYKITPWFKDFKEDIRRNPFKEKLSEENIPFTEKPFYDTMRLSIDFNQNVEIVIHFYSAVSDGKDPEEWQLYSEDKLNWKFGALYVSDKINGNKV